MKTMNDLTSIMNGCNCKSVEAIEEQYQQRGIRFMSIRQHILKLIWDSDCAIKAYDFLE